MPETVSSFSGDYLFLSNFYPSLIEFEMFGEKFTAPTVEHAFQAAKTMVSTLDNPETVQYMIFSILTAQTPGQAKKKGRLLPIDVARWDLAAQPVMRSLLLRKFSDPVLGRMLASTGDAVLIEGNTWGDRYWGQVDGVGENHLGRLLMSVREQIKGMIP